MGVRLLVKPLLLLRHGSCARCVQVRRPRLCSELITGGERGQQVLSVRRTNVAPALTMVSQSDKQKTSVPFGQCSQTDECGL